jgi:hypothetical protein
MRTSVPFHTFSADHFLKHGLAPILICSATPSVDTFFKEELLPEKPPDPTSPFFPFCSKILPILEALVQPGLSDTRWTSFRSAFRRRNNRGQHKKQPIPEASIADVRSQTNLRGRVEGAVEHRSSRFFKRATTECRRK